MRKVDSAETAPATNGEATAGMMIFSTMFSHCTPLVPREAKADPTNPPNRASEELEGMPSNQVKRFHNMAPMSPAKTTRRRLLD